MSTTSILRHINAIRCLRLLKGSGVMSRSELARRLDVTRTTVGNAVKVLLDAELVVEPAQVDSDRAQTRVGRPGVGVSLNPTGAYFVGLDISTNSITAVLIDLSATVVARLSEPLGADARDVEAGAARMAALAKRAMDGAGQHRDRVRGIGVSIPGLVNRDGCVVVAPLLGWRGVDVKALLRAALPEIDDIRICNDAVAVGSAICANAAEGEMEDVLLVLISEGIGSVAIRQGRVVEGHNGFAGEIGQMIMAPSVSEPTAPSFQMLAGERSFAPFLPPGRPSIDSVPELAGRAPDGPFRHALDRWADHLATGFLNAIWLLDPKRIVVSGTLAPLYPLVADRVAATLGGAISGRRPPPVAVSRYGGEDAAVGAAAMIREGLFALPNLGDGSPE